MAATSDGQGHRLRGGVEDDGRWRSTRSNRRPPQCTRSPTPTRKARSPSKSSRNAAAGILPHSPHASPGPRSRPLVCAGSRGGRICFPLGEREPAPSLISLPRSTGSRRARAGDQLRPRSFICGRAAAPPSAGIQPSHVSAPAGTGLARSPGLFGTRHEGLRPKQLAPSRRSGSARQGRRKTRGAVCRGLVSVGVHARPAALDCGRLVR